MKFSESTKNIFKALADFRKEVLQPKKDADNPFFESKYVPLENVIDVIDKVAPAHGLSYFQNTTTDEMARAGIQTTITHESGEYIIFDWLFMKPDKNTPQGIGSAITYGRRYTLSSAFGIASDVDDDGNEASGNRNGKKGQGDPELSGKQQFLSDKSKEFNDKYKISKTTFYAGLGHRLGQEPIEMKLADLVKVAKEWEKELNEGGDS